MTSLPRILALMGSGETAPTMVKVHRSLLERVGAPPAAAVLLDTPFGFQANADDLTARARSYFRESVGVPLEVASYRNESEQGSAAHEAALAALREAAYVFAGPGSPTYALRTWEPSQVPAVLREKLQRGGCVTFASAAALTLGVVTVPVYEIYKVGEAPAWRPGLDLLAEVGLHAAVVPHYDNAEGGTHDTRFCYLGEERLAALEADLPDGAFVLGVDEHTGCILDLDAGTATVVGNGGVTVRAGGRSQVLVPGDDVPIADLSAVAASLRSADGGTPSSVGAASSAATAGESSGAAKGADPLLAAVDVHEEAFVAALATRDVGAAVQAALDLDHELQAWSTDSLQSDHLDRGRSVLRSMIVRLGQLAETGARDPRELVGPYVEALLDARARARAEKRFDESDALRDQLVAIGVEVRDTPEGSEWNLGG